MPKDQGAWLLQAPFSNANKGDAHFVHKIKGNSYIF